MITFAKNYNHVCKTHYCQAMNILHLPSWFPTPDDPTLGNFCIRMIDALPRECRSVILSVCNGKELEKPFEVHETHGTNHIHVQVVVRPPKIHALRKLQILRMYQSGLDYIKRHFFTPDLIHLHVAHPVGRIALLWKKRYGIPYLLTEHWSVYQPTNSDVMRGRLKRTIVRVTNNAAAVMPVSLDLQHCMESHGIHNHFKVIYNSVDTDLFHPGTLSKSDKKRILHISTLVDEVKNFSGILRTVGRLRQQRDDFELHVIHDYDAAGFKDFVQTNHLEDCVFFHGKKASAEVAQAYRESDFLVLFSNFENLPCVITEAFASGIPVISTAVGGIPEIISPERGILVPAGDEEALLQGMSGLLDHCREYNRDAIRDYALRTFAAPEIGRQIFEEYKKIAIE